MAIKEYGQAAGEVELQDNPGPIKNQEGEAIVEVTNDGKFRILNESDSAQNLEMSVLSNGNPVLDMNGSTGGIAFLRSTAAYSFMQFQNPATGQADNVSDGLTVGCSSRNGVVRMRNNVENDATLTIGVNDSDAITIDASLNATFVQNLSANGNATLGDASSDTHTVNGSLGISDTSNTATLSTTSSANLLTEGTPANFYNIVRGPTGAYSIYQNNTTGDADGSGKGLEVGCGQNIAYVRMYGNGTPNSGTLNIGAGGTGGLTFSDENDITVLAGYLALESEEATPTTPADGDGGILYVKSDGKLYFISHETAETDLTSGGGGGLTYENKTSTFTAEGNYFYTVSTSGGDVTVNLPAASGVAGKTVDVCHKTTGNTITIDGNADERINGATTLTLSGIAYQNVTLFCTGTEWIIR